LHSCNGIPGGENGFHQAWIHKKRVHDDFARAEQRVPDPRSSHPCHPRTRRPRRSPSGDSNLPGDLPSCTVMSVAGASANQTGPGHTAADGRTISGPPPRTETQELESRHAGVCSRSPDTVVVTRRGTAGREPPARSLRLCCSAAKPFERPSRTPADGRSEIDREPNLSVGSRRQSLGVSSAAPSDIRQTSARPVVMGSQPAVPPTRGRSGEPPHSTATSCPDDPDEPSRTG